MKKDNSNICVQTYGCDVAIAILLCCELKVKGFGHISYESGLQVAAFSLCIQVVHRLKGAARADTLMSLKKISGKGVSACPQAERQKTFKSCRGRFQEDYMLALASPTLSNAP